MQKKQGVGVAYNETDEYVAFYAKGYYVLVRESSLCGLDYTIYDASFREVDGGVITGTEDEDKIKFGCMMLSEDAHVLAESDDVMLVDYDMVEAIVDSKPAFVEKQKPTVAVDFDGTLVNCPYPQMENPDLSLISFIKEHSDDYVWTLNTCRKGQGLIDAVYYMAANHSVFFDYVNSNTDSNIAKYGDTKKVYADIYVDNSAMTSAAFLINSNKNRGEVRVS